MPKIVPGEGPRHARLVLVGEAPGRQEAEQGRPFVGRAGRFLNKTLARLGIDRRKVYITNAVKVRPTRKIAGRLVDRKPSKKELEKWLPVLQKELRNLRPRVIVLLGDTAAKAVLGAKVSVGECRTKPAKRGRALVMCTYHPAAALRNRAYRKSFIGDLRKAKRAAGLSR